MMERWDYEELMNDNNVWEHRVPEVAVVEQKVANINKNELKKMRSGKAFAPDNIAVEVWRSLGKRTVDFWSTLFYNIFESKKCLRNKGEMFWCPFFY